MATRREEEGRRTVSQSRCSCVHYITLPLGQIEKGSSCSEIPPPSRSFLYGRRAAPGSDRARPPFPSLPGERPEAGGSSDRRAAHRPRRRVGLPPFSVAGGGGGAEERSSSSSESAELQVAPDLRGLAGPVRRPAGPPHPAHAHALLRLRLLPGPGLLQQVRADVCVPGGPWSDGPAVRRSGGPAVRQSPSDEALAGREERRTASAARRWTRGGGQFPVADGTGPTAAGQLGGGDRQLSTESSRPPWSLASPPPCSGGRPGPPALPPGASPPGRALTARGQDLGGPGRVHPEQHLRAVQRGLRGRHHAGPPSREGRERVEGPGDREARSPVCFSTGRGGRRAGGDGRRGAKARQEKKGRQQHH